jgi:hypothetical protein
MKLKGNKYRAERRSIKKFNRSLKNTKGVQAWLIGDRHVGKADVNRQQIDRVKELFNNTFYVPYEMIRNPDHTDSFMTRAHIVFK